MLQLFVIWVVFNFCHGNTQCDFSIKQENSRQITYKQIKVFIVKTYLKKNGWETNNMHLSLTIKKLVIDVKSSTFYKTSIGFFFKLNRKQYNKIPVCLWNIQFYICVPQARSNTNWLFIIPVGNFPQFCGAQNFFWWHRISLKRLGYFRGFPRYHVMCNLSVKYLL